MDHLFTFERVMIVDDNEVDRYTASYIMKKHRFAKEVLEFDMATKAIEYLDKHQHAPELLPEIILLDINMPTMDGFQFLEQLSKLHLVRKLSCCIIMLSSSLNPADHSRAEASPVIKQFLNKPLKKSDLEGIAKFYAQHA
jgi:CheY-like chemotaxis protein